MRERSSHVGPIQSAVRSGARAAVLLFAATAFPVASVSQVFIVSREKPKGIPDYKPTHVVLDPRPLTPAVREQLVRGLMAEQGFAMRPLPLGTPGLTLHANGDLAFGKDDYYDSLVRKGISVKTGERVSITNVKFEGKTIVFDFNGGPERKHKFLRHLSIGGDPNYTAPVVQDDGVLPTGSRLTLVFDKFIPDVSAEDVQALLAPVLDFRTKTPVEAYTATLPPKLRDAILNHQALVGMNRKMVTYALGAPENKVREKDGQMPYEEWIYGSTPKPVQFVRFNGDRCIRIETALYGRTPTIRTEDETDGYLSPHPIHTISEGDAVASSNGERGPAAAPSLRRPGEDLPQSSMQPVHNPTDPVKASPLPTAPSGHAPTGPATPTPAAGSTPATPAQQLSTK